MEDSADAYIPSKGLDVVTKVMLILLPDSTVWQAYAEQCRVLWA